MAGPLATLQMFCQHVPHSRILCLGHLVSFTPPWGLWWQDLHGLGFEAVEQLSSRHRVSDDLLYSLHSGAMSRLISSAWHTCMLCNLPTWLFLCHSTCKQLIYRNVHFVNWYCIVYFQGRILLMNILSQKMLCRMCLKRVSPVSYMYSGRHNYLSTSFLARVRLFVDRI